MQRVDKVEDQKGELEEGEHEGLREPGADKYERAVRQAQDEDLETVLAEHKTEVEKPPSEE